MKYAIIFIRTSIGLAIVWLIYQQAGWATALFAALMLIHTEIVSKVIDTMLESQRLMTDFMKKMVGK